jgi:ATP/maltotriose-dependent transcriptional regulator MalT
LCQQAATIRDFADIGKLAAWGAAIASCGLGDYEAARAHLSVAFKYLTNIQGTVGEVVSLPIAAIICAHQGQPVRAVELLALAFTHPVRASGWMERWPLLDRLQTDLELTLGSEAYSAAWERGKQLSIDSVVVELKAQLFTEDTSAFEQANRALPDPLSPREFEVLILIADGLTNREIAGRLFVGVSTVKKHIQHIYAKLDTRNRTGTIVRARELDLIP